VPLEIPVVSSMAGCVCVSWWKSIRQVSREAGTAPSCGSNALPENAIVVPPEYRDPTAGVRMVTAGGKLVWTVSVAALLKTVPNEFETRHR
jgi:hypothetical protein